MISNLSVGIFITSIVAMVIFIVKMSRQREIKLIHKIYMILSAALVVWLISIIALKFTAPDNMQMLAAWEALSYLGATIAPVMAVDITLAFTRGWEKISKWTYLLLVIPVITNIIVWTNPLHNLFYINFSLNINEVEFGPWFYINAAYVFICMAYAVIAIIRFAVSSRTNLYLKQAIFFSVGNLLPIVVNIVALTQVTSLSIAATPLAFLGTIIFHGIAIYRLHLLDIKPIAMQQVLNQISDCYLITGENGLILGYNEPFMELIGRQNGIAENRRLQDCLNDEDIENKTSIYNLLTSIDSCRRTASPINFEQAINQEDEDGWRKLHFIVEVNPLVVKDEIGGFIAIYKDVTKLRESMKKLQDSQVTLMEQERLASLGQMLGGLAHNLKTPIMSIAGSAAALNNLVAEASVSIDDPEVTVEDFNEIHGEMQDWLQKVRDACSYMSDIITAVKGQAGSMDLAEFVDFSIEDTIKRVSLLLRHELIGGKCKLVTRILIPEVDKRDILIHGDINNLVQVINNMVSNAVYAQKADGKHEIEISVDSDNDYLYIRVKDWGEGIKPEIKARLFRQMVTNKGNKGTGLGVYISYAVIRGKFGGDIELTDNPEGGSIFSIKIPLENAHIKKKGNYLSNYYGGKKSYEKE